MDVLLFDLRYTLRLLSRSPGFTLLCVAVIALAISLTLTIYVVVGNQGVRPLPLPKGERYVALQPTDKDTGNVYRGDRFNAFFYRAIAERSKSFELLGAAGIHGSFTISDDGIAESHYGTAIDPRLLHATDAVPIKGRNLVASDAVPGAETVAVIGHNLWQNYYAGRADIIGHRSRIEGKIHTIVGVMPKGFRYPTDHHLWTALQLPASNSPGAEKFALTPIGILSEGVSIDQANAELKVIGQQLSSEYPDDFKSMSIIAQPYIYSASLNNWGTMNAVMLSAALIILLLACLNVGNLLLVRVNERNQELVIRSALGGSRRRIIQQVLMESFIICLAGGIIGVLLGNLGADFVRYQTEVVVGSSYLPFWMNFEIGIDIFLLTIGITAMVWLFAGGIPALRASRLEITSALGGGSKGVASKGSGSVAKVLVASEVVCSFFLLILSGAFVSAVYFSNQIDYGVDTKNYVTGFVSLKESIFPAEADRIQYYNDLKSTLVDEPGISAVSFTSALPGMGFRRIPFNVEDRDLKENGEYPKNIVIPVDKDYFSVLDINLLDGRHFNSADDDNSLPVVIIEQALAEKMWPQESAIGKRIHSNPEGDMRNTPSIWLTVIGVVEHVDQGQMYSHFKGLNAVYRPLAQTAPDWQHIVLKFSEAPKLFEKKIKIAASKVNQDTPLRHLRKMEEALFLNTRILQTLSELFLVVALIALILAGTGIYGVVSRTVLLRSHEMGVRRALGQTDQSTILLFVRHGIIYLLVGAILGGGGALIASNLLTSEFPNLLNAIVSVTVFVFIVMTALVLVACYVPAMKIVSKEPATTLSYS